MKNIAATAAVAVLFFASAASAEQQTIAAKVSDSLCGKSHQGMKINGKQPTDVDCTDACVKMGAKYVLATDKGAVLNVANQDALKGHAGQSVRVTGDVKGDTITISNVETLPAKK